MIERYQKLAVELTQKIVQQYWGGKPELLLRYIHPEILWIGSTDSEYVHGAEEMKKRINANLSEMPPVYMDEQQYEIVYRDAGACLVVGRYHVFTKPESGLLLSEKQRVSFLWIKNRVPDAKRIWIKHIHLSNTLKIQGEDEYFPVREGRKNYHNISGIVEERGRGDSIAVTDISRVVRVLSYSEIAYIKADRNYTEFYTTDKSCIARVRENLSVYIQKLPDSFIQISRGCVMNRDYIKSIKGRQLTMLDGTTIQIPTARCARIRQNLSKR